MRIVRVRSDPRTPVLLLLLLLLLALSCNACTQFSHAFFLVDVTIQVSKCASL